MTHKRNYVPFDYSIASAINIPINWVKVLFVPFLYKYYFTESTLDVMLCPVQADWKSRVVIF